jgi:hypothetical protein
VSDKRAKPSSASPWCWPAVVGRTYQVQYTADMGNVNWTNTGPEINATRDLVAVAVCAPSAVEKRFYRVAVVE